MSSWAVRAVLDGRCPAAVHTLIVLPDVVVLVAYAGACQRPHAYRAERRTFALSVARTNLGR